MQVKSPTAEFSRNTRGSHRQAGPEHDALLDQIHQLQAELVLKDELLAQHEQMAVLGELAAGVAQEIRDPLGGIRHCLDLLARERGMQRNASIARIRGVVARLDRVVHDVLAHSRQVEANRALTPLTYVVMEAVNLAARELPEGEIKLYVDCGEGQADVDADLVARALLNLIVNAAQAIRGRKDGRKGGAVHVSAHIDDAVAEFEVRDDGPGIPADLLTRIFVPAFSSREGGTGLGLALCRRIADTHGGEIVASNNRQGGARFTLRIPGAVNE